ncbi:MAG: insulinase family protein, partial [Planctomycetota bacterium]
QAARTAPNPRPARRASALAAPARPHNRSDPQHRATLAVRARHLPDPLGRSGYGDEPGLRALTRDELVEGWERCALPVGSIIAISGAVDADPVRAALDRELDGWAGETEAFAIDDSPQRGYAHEDDDGEQVQILMAHDAPPAGTSETMKQRLLTAVLSGGMSGRLFTEVRERRGLCYSVSASYSADRDFGVVSAYVGTTPERAQESLDVLNDEMRKIGSPGSEITRDEYDRARVGLKSRLVFSGESTSARAGSLAGDWYRLGRTRTLEERAAEVDAVSLEELNAYAAGLDMGRLTIQTVGPRALTPPA